MSTVINGNAANVTTPLSATVASCVSGTGGNVRVGTTTNHLFGPSDWVYIVGVTGTTEANGFWQISKVIDATHFEIPVTFANAYVSGGTVRDKSLSPQIQWPSDGDPASIQLSGLLSGAQALADRTQWLAAQIADISYVLVSIGTTALTNGGNWSSATAYATTVGGTPGPILQRSVNCAPGDVVEILCAASIGAQSGAGTITGNVRLEYVEQYAGSGTTGAILGSPQMVSFGTTSGSYPMTIQGLHIVTLPGTLGLFLNGYVSATCPGFAVSGASPGNCIVKVWRPSL